MKVSIVIPTKNGELIINDTLYAIFNQKLDFKIEVIIVDSGSTDKTLDVVKQYPVVVKKIEPQEFNHGLTRNYGVSIATGKFVVLLVQDAVPSNKTWLLNIIKEFKDNKVAGVYCRQVPFDNCDPLKAIQIKTGFTGRNKRIVKYIKNIDEYNRLSPMLKYQLVSFDNVCSCIRKSVWKKYQFDRTDFGEDLMWAKKVMLAGYKLVYTPHSSVFHSHNRSILYEFKRDFVCHKTMYKLFGLNTVPQIKISNIFGIIMNTWRLLWKNNYRIKHWKYYFISPIRNIF